MSCLSGRIPKMTKDQYLAWLSYLVGGSERGARRWVLGRGGRGEPTPGGPCINATSLDSRAKRIASRWESLRVWSKKSMLGSVSGRGVGESRPKRMRMRGVCSLSVIFCSRCIV